MLTDKRIVVTGAASGIGAACADRLDAEGATVVGVDLTDQHAGDSAPSWELRIADVTDPESPPTVPEPPTPST